MTNKRIGLIAVAILAVVSLAAPFAAAQTTTFTVGTPTLNKSQIKPETETAELSVPWKYNLATPAQSGIGQAQSSVVITWTPSCTNPNVIITGAQTETVAITPGEAEETGTSKFTVATTQDAPGETLIACKIRGSVSSLNDVLAPAPAAPSESPFSVVSAYLGLLSVNVPNTIKQAGPQKQIKYDLEISNLGNSRSTINFLLQSESKGWNPVPPTPIVLESRAQGGQETTKTVSFLVSTPFKNGWNNKDTTFVLQITPQSTKDTEKTGQAVQVNVLARVRGVYVPSLEPAIMLGAVLGVALVARMARKDE